MTQRKNMATSVKQRLLNLARHRGEDFSLLLTHYGIERLLYRLSQSENGNDFVLKGAMLFRLWTPVLHRNTRDLDLLAHGDPELDRLVAVFRNVCRTPVEDDGLEFHVDTVRGDQIRESAEYDGLRILLEASLGKARIRLQIDLGFGDAMVPPPERVDFPVFLDLPRPRLRAYSRYTVVAEKVQAMVDLGMANSRMKDFFDLNHMAATFDFDGGILTAAIEATFSRRRTPLPKGVPTALTDGFSSDTAKQSQWQGFLNRSRLVLERSELKDTIFCLRGFLLPPLDSLACGEHFGFGWTASDTWRP